MWRTTAPAFSIPCFTRTRLYKKVLTSCAHLCKGNALTADVAQLAEHQVVALGVVSSILIIRPISEKYKPS